jgi:DDE superfamily endonuclease
MKDCSGLPASYFSGHYGFHGLNVLAVCDAKCRFQFFGIIAPGKCGNQVAFEMAPIFQYAHHLPDGFYMIGNAAYLVEE